jgi:hypothetical protein
VRGQVAVDPSAEGGAVAFQQGPERHLVPILESPQQSHLVVGAVRGLCSIHTVPL